MGAITKQKAKRISLPNGKHVTPSLCAEIVQPYPLMGASLRKSYILTADDMFPLTCIFAGFPIDSLATIIPAI